jgi:hypothetical protein
MLEYHIPTNRELVNCYYAMQGWNDDEEPCAGDFARNTLAHCVPFLICRSGVPLCLFTLYDFECGTCMCCVYLFRRDLGVWRAFPQMLRRIFAESGLYEINATISVRKENSLRIARKIGFREVGKSDYTRFLTITEKEVYNG